MIGVLQVSDPHFGTERPPVITALRALSAQLAPALIVLSGDITQRARRQQFAAAREFIDSLGIAALVAIPGNHDIPLYNIAARMFAPYRGHRRAFGANLEPEFQSRELLVLCVNTTRAYRHKNGEISTAQIERVARRLHAAAPEQLRIVVTHQPVAVMRAEDEHDRLRGGERAARRWADAGADVILGGHIHLPYVLPLHERLAGLPRRVWAVQAGTAVSARIRHEADNSINFIRYHGRGDGADAPRRATVERWDYREASRRFDLQHAEELELQRG